MKQQLIIYLDTDANGDDLLDSAGNPIPAGWYRYDWPLSPEPTFHPTRSRNELALARKFDEALARVAAELFEEELASAQRAIVDALRVIDGLGIVPTPWVGVDDDGVALVQWRSIESGVLLVFTGDGTFVASVRDQAIRNYLGAPKELQVSDTISEELKEAIYAVR